MEFTLPPARYGEVWETVLDTAQPAEQFEDGAAAKAGGLVPVRDRSLQVRRRG
jgi:isoamylase